ncbi:3-isopropylmalate dehydrogenase [Membranihabitans maritimus]|uniref:3-isopropylmalate dehydrogenase n=1 Tax=Membranihabitans maritimus TaxID=2904244 RepID=UPI001F03014E|nr:3-isopropylmalate dehydrogenase [Membranihabitans maritimus]
MNKKIAVLAGDGIGPEVTKEARKVLDAIAKKYNHTFEYQEADAGAIAIDRHGDPLPSSTLEICKNTDAVLFGAIGDPKYDNDPEAKVRPEQGLLKLRKELQLFANLRPVMAFDSILDLSPLRENRIKGCDFIIYRELTGGIYFGEKKEDDGSGKASDLMYYEEEEIQRIAKLAFEAAQNRRKKITLVDKANVLASSRLWRKVVQKLASDYPDVTLDFLFVDNAAMQVILNPSQFDVILTSNMFGDIISDEASTISGSLGLLPSASIGVSSSMFEPIHGSYPQAKGQDIANPMAAILSAAMMLEHWNLFDEANSIKEAVNTCLENNYATVDINPGSAKKCSEVGDYIVHNILKD